MKPLKHYINRLTDRCKDKFGEVFVTDNEELIECAARNKRLLERFDDEIDKGELISVASGSMGQTKEDINPLVKHRNDVAKLYADNLEALQLTPRSRYKKTEGKTTEASDPMSEYLKNIQV